MYTQETSVKPISAEGALVNPNQSRAVQQPDDTLRTFLERRERELTHQVAHLRAQIESKETELAEIQTARASLSSSVPATTVPAPAAPPPVPDTNTFDAAADQIRAAEENRRVASIGHPMQQGQSVLIGGVPQKRTIKSMIVTALTSHFDDGATLSELRNFIKDVFGQEIDRTSISPQLARLREDGVVEKRGKKWKLSEPASQRGITNNLSPQKSEDT
jgi:hypothetical protein